jgi:acetyl/propionyl-CoA carboxylase alpha subunit
MSSADAMFVREADEAVRIFSAERDAYLDYDVLERALRESVADAVWVGWGFVSEDPEFADRVEKWASSSSAQAGT